MYLFQAKITLDNTDKVPTAGNVALGSENPAHNAKGHQTIFDEVNDKGSNKQNTVGDLTKHGRAADGGNTMVTEQIPDYSNVPTNIGPNK